MNGPPSEATNAPPFALLLPLLPAAIPQIVQSVLFLLVIVVMVPMVRATVLNLFRALFYVLVLFFKVCDALSEWLWSHLNKASTAIAVFLARNLIAGLLARGIACLFVLCALVGVMVFLS